MALYAVSHPAGCSPIVHVAVVASFSDGMSSAAPALRGGAGGVCSSRVPAPAARPPGVLTLLGPRDGSLWLLNSQVV